MFGDHCEWLTPCSQISTAVDERFYLLEVSFQVLDVVTTDTADDTET